MQANAPVKEWQVINFKQDSRSELRSKSFLGRQFLTTGIYCESTSPSVSMSPHDRDKRIEALEAEVSRRQEVAACALP
jgi:hypothetical protein